MQDPPDIDLCRALHVKDQIGKRLDGPNAQAGKI